MIHYFIVAIERERDELLALLDVQERQRYEVARSQSTAEEQAYNNFTSAEVNFCCFAFMQLPVTIRHNIESTELHKTVAR